MSNIVTIEDCSKGTLKQYEAMVKIDLWSIDPDLAYNTRKRKRYTNRLENLYGHDYMHFDNILRILRLYFTHKTDAAMCYMSLRGSHETE